MLPAPEAHPWYHRRHHTDDGRFRNLQSTARPASFGKAMSWFAGRAFRGKQNMPPPVRLLAPEALTPPARGVRITWLGHAALLLQWPGCTVLTDPMLGHRASPFSFAGPERLVAPPLSISDLPPLDVVLLSHDHYDHLDRGSVEAVAAHGHPLFLVPLGVDARLQRWGIDHMVAADWHQFVAVDGWRFHCTPAQHFAGRGLFDRNTTLWAGWYITPPEATQPRVFFAGDTGYAPHFTPLRQRLGAPDVACLPIGANEPRWMMQPVHMNAEEALQAFDDLGAHRFVPIHWGTFDLADEPVQAPALALRQLAARRDRTAAVSVLDVGGQATVHRRTTREESSQAR